MKNMMKSFAIASVIWLAAGCNNSGNSQDFDYGRVENNLYLNNYFSFKMNLPAEWVVLTKAQVDELTKAGQELVAGDDENMKAVFKASEINTANLLGVYQYELGTAVDFNPNFMIVAENLKNTPGIKKGSDYLFQARKVLEQGQFKYDYISPDYENEKINGTEYYKMECRLNYMGMEIKQVYYSAVVKGFSFNVIISFVTDEQKEALLGSIKTMSFLK